jgi:hypothetical protein
MMRLEDPKQPFPVDVKRFYVPFAKLEGECPNCHEPIVYAFGDQYLSYPTANAVNDFGLWCSKCDHEWSVKIRLDITLTLEETNG